MKNVLNAVSTILIILFFGWQFCGDCFETKCDKSDTKECDYSEWGKSGVTKCKSYETKKECTQADRTDGIDAVGVYEDDTDLDDADVDDADIDDADVNDADVSDADVNDAG